MIKCLSTDIFLLLTQSNIVLKTIIGLNTSLKSRLNENLLSAGECKKKSLDLNVYDIVELLFLYIKYCFKDIKAFIGLSGGLLTLLFKIKFSGKIY